MPDDLNIRYDEVLIEKNGEITSGSSSNVPYENRPPIRPRPAESDPRSDWIDYLVDLGANREYLVEHFMTSSELIYLADAFGG